MCSKISGIDSILQKFLCLKNQRAALFAVLTETFKENVDHKFMLKHTCAEEHCNYILIAQSSFNCFAKNELKRIN